MLIEVFDSKYPKQIYYENYSKKGMLEGTEGNYKTKNPSYFWKQWSIQLKIFL